MPPRAERSGRRLVVRAIMLALVALAALPAYVALDPAWQPAAVQLACGALVAIGAMRARRRVREAMDGGPPSSFDAAAPPAAEPEIDARFLALRDDLIAGTRSRRYFDVILWPRLCELSRGDLVRPPARRYLRWRGPSLAQLAALVARVETCR
jgi:hypothetical protein